MSAGTTAFHCIAMLFARERRISGTGTRTSGAAPASASGIFTETKPCDDKIGRNAHNQKNNDMFRHNASFMVV
jgi:hypothetical protein